jgi:hypothetical protein
MVAIPAWLWRFGLIVRALIAGLALGVFVGLLAWIGSDAAAPALVVLVVVTLVYGAFMARWMSKYWPGAKDLSGPDRVAVVRAARRGRDIGDPRLAPGVIEYRRALQTAAERFRLWWWLIALLGGRGTGRRDRRHDLRAGPRGRGVMALLCVLPDEAWWWPRRQGAQDRPKIVEHLGILDG